MNINRAKGVNLERVDVGSVVDISWQMDVSLAVAGQHVHLLHHHGHGYLISWFIISYADGFSLQQTHS